MVFKDPLTVLNHYSVGLSLLLKWIAGRDCLPISARVFNARAPIASPDERSGRAILTGNACRPETQLMGPREEVA